MLWSNTDASMSVVSLVEAFHLLLMHRYRSLVSQLSLAPTYASMSAVVQFSNIDTSEQFSTTLHVCKDLMRPGGWHHLDLF